MFEIVKESRNPEAEKFKGSIDAIRDKRKLLIEQIKKVRKKVNYKLAEQETIERFLQMNEGVKDYEDKLRKVRMLTKQKRRLEFSISTESFSLADEKLLIGKIKLINAELDGSLRVVKLFRKRDLVKKDLEEYTAQLNKLDVEIADLDKQLDDLYSGLRKLLKMGEAKRERPKLKKRDERPRTQEVNLEDIAIIKKKK